MCRAQKTQARDKAASGFGGSPLWGRVGQRRVSHRPGRGPQAAAQAERRAGKDDRGPAKSRGLLRERERSVNDTYAFIEAEKTTHGVAFLCRLLKVARSSFYAWLAAQKTRAARQGADAALTHEITVIHLASRGTYGVPRVHAELRRLGRSVNHKRVARLMREHGIQGAHRRRRRSLTRPDKKASPAPDLIGRDFHADIPGTKLVGDITFLPTAEGWLYLACWLDLATREVVGYAMADHHRPELVVDALNMAHGRAGLKPGCVIHSDRGSEYTSAQFRDRISELVLRQSCGRTGSCFDNAAAESFWALLKEEIGTRIWPDRATARTEVFNFVETFYNRRLRKHKTFGYPTPAETRQRHQHTLAA
ncbi:IS3 family transposase [Streptomyces sp. NPDC056660]|uniref:IS3 family transposase n=1 Tax=Streptomyces sp. NPDC056660 TaxID=3345897 RepID=UPI0036C5DDCA